MDKFKIWLIRKDFERKKCEENCLYLEGKI